LVQCRTHPQKFCADSNPVLTEKAEAMLALPLMKNRKTKGHFCYLTKSNKIIQQ